MRKKILKIIIGAVLLTGFIASINSQLLSQELRLIDNPLQELYSFTDSIESRKFENNSAALNQVLAKITDLIDHIKSEDLAVFKTVKGGKTLLRFAVLYNYVPLIEKLINKDINVDEKDGVGYTVLAQAPYSIHADTIVKMLIKAGADVNANTVSIPLSNALVNKKKLVVEMLLAAGANIDAQDANLSTPLTKFKSLLDSFKSIADTNNDKKSLEAIRSFLQQFLKLRHGFKNNIPYNQVQQGLDRKVIEIFIMNTLNQDPSQLTNLQRYFKDNNIIDVVNTYKDFVHTKLKDYMNHDAYQEKLLELKHKKQFTDIDIITYK